MAGTIDLTRFIRDVPDFPKPGILFRDITPLLANPQALAAAIAGMAAPWRTERLDAVAAVEARGLLETARKYHDFVPQSALAQTLHNRVQIDLSTRSPRGAHEHLARLRDLEESLAPSAQVIEIGCVIDRPRINAGLHARVRGLRVRNVGRGRTGSLGRRGNL
jgi:hypothetical protein